MTNPSMNQYNRAARQGETVGLEEGEDVWVWAKAWGQLGISANDDPREQALAELGEEMIQAAIDALPSDFARGVGGGAPGMSDEMELEIETCARIFAKLYEYLDRVLSPGEEEEVRQHLEVCALCAHHFQFEEQLLATIRKKCQSSPAPAHLRRRLAEILDTL
jgi:mycothiol system anti-sigma-R factor